MSVETIILSILAKVVGGFLGGCTAVFIPLWLIDRAQRKQMIREQSEVLKRINSRK